MPNRKVGSKPVIRKNFSCLKEDEELLNDIVIKHNIDGGVSALIRVFLRLYSKYGNDLIMLNPSSFTNIEKLVDEIIEENDRVQVEPKVKTQKGSSNVQR